MPNQMGLARFFLAVQKSCNVNTMLPPIEEGPGAIKVKEFPPLGLEPRLATPPPTDVTVMPSTASSLISGLILQIKQDG